MLKGVKGKYQASSKSDKQAINNLRDHKGACLQSCFYEGMLLPITSAIYSSVDQYFR